MEHLQGDKGPSEVGQRLPPPASLHLSLVCSHPCHRHASSSVPHPQSPHSNPFRENAVDSDDNSPQTALSVVPTGTFSHMCQRRRGFKDLASSLFVLRTTPFPPSNLSV